MVLSFGGSAVFFFPRRGSRAAPRALAFSSRNSPAAHPLEKPFQSQQPYNKTDKLDADDKKKVVEAVKEALEWLEERGAEADPEDINDRRKELEDVVQPIMAKIYAAGGGKGGAGGGGSGGDDADSHDEL